MNLILENYNYPHCYAKYTQCIVDLRQAKIKGEVIVAKPVLLLALIEGINQEVFSDNKFVLNDWLEDKYLELMKKYTINSQFDKPADIANPFWHLSTDGFWHLQLKAKEDMSTTPSRAWLKENVTCASFDDDLWVLLQSKEWRTRLREYIVEHKLSDGRWLHRITEGLATLAAILMVA